MDKMVNHLKLLLFILVMTLPVAQAALVPTLTIERIAFTSAWRLNAVKVTDTNPIVATKGEVVVIEWAVTGQIDFDDVLVQIVLSALTSNKHKQAALLDAVPWETELRQGQWGEQSLDLGHQNIVYNANKLAPVHHNTKVSISANRTKRFTLILRVPPNAKSGEYIGKITLLNPDMPQVFNRFSIRVLPLVLPQVKPLVGIYQTNLSTPQRSCQQRYLASLGLKLAVGATSGENMLPKQTVMAETLARYRQSAKRLLANFPYESVGVADKLNLKRHYRRVSSLHLAYLDMHLNRAVNTGEVQMLPDMALTRGYGVFQSSHDDRLSYIGEWLGRKNERLVLLSAGKAFAALEKMVVKPQDLTATGIKQLTDIGFHPWFFHMSDKRLAAGLYLWRSKAFGYIQQQPQFNGFIYHTPEDCRFSDFTVNSELLALSLGVTDLRWLKWLEVKAQAVAEDNHVSAKIMLDYFKQQIADSWQDNIIARPSIEQRADQLTRWRQELVDFAQQRYFKSIDNLPLK